MWLNFKSFLIWSLVVGGLGMFCILLYQSMEGEMKDMAEAFSNMGAFSDAFGMSTLSIATMSGYFATEVGTVHGLGSAMFAAILSIGIISKEEEGHSGEFLFSHPVSRKKIVAAKGLCVFIYLLLFTLLCTGLYELGFKMTGESVPLKGFLTFMGMQTVMNLEIGAVCFVISSLPGKNRTGTGIAIAVLMYFFDVIGRVVPDLKEYLFIGPFSYANASEILSGAELCTKGLIVAVMVMAVSLVGAFVIFDRRDLLS